MVLNLYKFSHAETSYNARREFVGGQSNHLPISERGNFQALALGERLFDEGIKFDRIYCSTALRTVETANITCKVIGFPMKEVVQVENLLELSQGDWEGRRIEEVYTPEILAEMRKKHWDFKAPNGESQRELEERIYGWVEGNLLRESSDLTVGIFGHGLATKCFLRRVFNSDPKLTYRICINNCSITHLKYSFSGQHEGWSVMKVNDDAHLARCGFGVESFV